MLCVYLDDMCSDYLITTRIQRDHPGPLGFPAEDRVWALTWVNIQTFFIPFRMKCQKNDAVPLWRRLPSFLFKKTDFNFLS